MQQVTETFRHPTDWRRGFFIGNGVIVGLLLGGAVFAMVFLPVLGKLFFLVLFLLAVVLLGLSARSLADRIRVTPEGLEGWTYLLGHEVIPWQDITLIQDFPAPAFAASRRVRVIGRAGRLAFTERIDNFERLLAHVKEAAPHASVSAQLPLWERMLWLR